MTNEEIVKLIKQGHNELMADLYRRNKPVIIIIAKRLQPDKNDFEDALQDAYFGLAEAVKGFDESKGCKFITYADYHIRRAINRGKHGVQHVPEWLTIQANKIRRAQNELAQELQRLPTTAEISYPYIIFAFAHHRRAKEMFCIFYIFRF